MRQKYQKTRSAVSAGRSQNLLSQYGKQLNLNAEVVLAWRILLSIDRHYKRRSEAKF